MKQTEAEKLSKIKTAAKKAVEDKRKKLAAKRANFKKKLNYNLLMVDLLKKKATEVEIFKTFEGIYKKKDPKVGKEYIKERIEIYKKNAERVIAGTLTI